MEIKLNDVVHYICEQCGKEHDGSYGSGRFCSRICRSRYGASKVKHHVCNFKNVASAKGNWNCKDCELVFRTKHELYDHRYKVHKIKRRNRTNICSKCNKHYTGRLREHERICTAVRHDHKHTEETKQKLSKLASKIHHNGIWSKSGWYKGFWCESSWELAWVIYQIEHNIPFKRNIDSFKYIFENKVKRYYPDFILEDGTLVEIKGWHGKNWKAKIEQFPKNKKIIVLYKKEIQPYLNYAIEKYGKDFIKVYEK